MARNICLVGAGNISGEHASAIKTIPTLRLHCVVDPNIGAAQSLAAAYSIPAAYRSIEEAIAAGGIDCAHVLTPPDKHMDAALTFLRAGTHVYVEKPLGVSYAECNKLVNASLDSNVALGVNQNFVNHPAFAHLRKTMNSGIMGRSRLVSCVYNVPLRQLKSRQFGHWMFSEPKNILLEQAVHPLSQLIALTGPFKEINATAAAPIEISSGVPFYPSISIVGRSANLPYTMQFDVGGDFPFWQVSVVCDDGVAVADILSNRFYTHRRTRWFEPVDLLLSGLETGRSMQGASVINFFNYALAMSGLKRRNDSFFHSMQTSIARFHNSLDKGERPELDGYFGAEVVRIAEVAAEVTFTAPISTKVPCQTGEYDIAVIGGTGFIGTEVIKRLAADKGTRVGVMARNIRNLPAVFLHDNVVVMRGDACHSEDVNRFIGNAQIVICLAHGGGGKNYEEIRNAMVGSADVVARACIARGVQRLIYISSIASLYLGPQKGKVTGETLPDPKSRMRADYARAKAECERLLFTMHQEEQLPITILRPGIVLGDGAPPFHSGFGFFNTDQHCMGWNAGQNPLPLVLVEDVATAIALACAIPEINGRAFNLVGDVKMSARDYISELANALSRRLYFHPHSATRLWLVELGKWALKKAAGRKVPLPTRRDLLSRGLEADIDCADVKVALGWLPENDRQRFIARAISVHARL